MNWNENALHRAIGFFTNILPLAWVGVRREISQLPPENNKNPVVWAVLYKDGSVLCHTDPQYMSDHYPSFEEDLKEYWSATRVRDSLNDLRRIQQGATIAWPFVFFGGMAIGKWLL